MQLELDHIFVCVEPEAPSAELLIAFGLTEGIRRNHSGQGTANICFFFHNAFLELLWLRDINEVRSPVVRPLGLWERCHWRETQACPFGISFRRAAPGSLGLPFSTWDYRAPFLPPAASIPIAINSDNLLEPLLFISHSTQKPSTYATERRLPLVHQPELNKITALRVTLPGKRDFSAEVTILIELGLVQFLPGDCYQLEIEFDDAKQDKLQRFDPTTLPISIRW